MNSEKFDIQTAIRSIAWSGNYDRAQAGRIEEFLNRHQQLTLLAHVIQDGISGRINPFALEEIISRADRFGSYSKTIKAILTAEMDRRELAKLSNDEQISIETMEAQSVFMYEVLANVAYIYKQKRIPLPAELDLTRENNAANLQYLSQLFALICIGYKKPRNLLSGWRRSKR